MVSKLRNPFRHFKHGLASQAPNDFNEPKSMVPNGARILKSRELEADEERWRKEPDLYTAYQEHDRKAREKLRQDWDQYKRTEAYQRLAHEYAELDAIQAEAARRPSFPAKWETGERPFIGPLGVHKETKPPIMRRFSKK